MSRKRNREPRILQLEIESLAFGGAGVGRHDGKVHFVPGGFPGEEVEVEILGSRRKFDRARLLRVLRPSPDRREPLCSHSEYCGGCSVQELEYSIQLAAKADQVRDCLRRIGGFEVPEFGPALGSPDLQAYRNKMEFTFARRAWLPDGPPEEELPSPCLGLHVPGRFDAVFDLEDCILTSDRAVESLRIVRDFAREHRLTAYRSRSDEGLLRHLVVREGKHTGDFLLALVTRDVDPVFAELGPLLAEAIPSLTGLVLLVNRTKATIAKGDQEAVLYGRPEFTERLGGLTFELGAQSFFQTNTLGAELLIDAIRRILSEHVGLEGGRHLLDLYCGAGTIGLTLAKEFEEVTGIEQVSDAVQDARRNAERNGLSHVQFVEGDVEEWIRSDPQTGRFDAVIVDPPRAGLHPKALQTLPALAPPWILYVSCNPSTLARDAAGLIDAGYRPVTLQVVDLFPHTGHVESILLLVREQSAP